MEKMNEDFLKEKAKYMPTPNLIDRLREVKKIRDKAEQEYLVLSLELWDRTSTFNEIKKKVKVKE